MTNMPCIHIRGWCMDTFTHVCTADMHMKMCSNMCINMCMNMCMNMCLNECEHVSE